jgi:arginyl-tRNA synthetase
MEFKIRKAIETILTQIGAGDVAFVVERPAEASHGDYATNVALVASKALGRSPRESAQEMVEALSSSTLLGATSISKIEVAGPGFINFTLACEAVTLAVTEAVAQGSEWGRGTEENGKRIMVEYTDPNPFKEMHIGHLMSNVIGEALSRLVESEGAKVVRACYQGDVGPHVAKALWGLQKSNITDPVTAKEIGDAYAEASRAYDESPEIKGEIDALNQEIYAGTNHTVMELWRKGRDVSLLAFERLYKILGTHFDYYFFESETVESGLRIVTDGLTKGIFEKSDGAVIYRGEKKGLHTLVFITSRGTPTYETKDIGLAFLKEEKCPSDESIIVTSIEQIGHFKVLLSALSEIAPLLAKKTRHIPHGLLRLTSGKMSSREGNVITASDFIRDIIEKTSEKNPDPLVAEQVALGAVKYMILRQAPGGDIIFDPEKSLSLEGDSGPYLQYALVRAKSVVKQAGAQTRAGGSGPEEPYLIEKIILHYPEVVTYSVRKLAPNLLVNYLTELAGEWNSFYAQERIVGGDYEAYKLLVARAFVQTMTNGLTLLGIPTPERM